METKLTLLYARYRDDMQDYIVKLFGSGLYAELEVMDSKLDNGSKRSVLKGDIIICKVEKIGKRKTFLMGTDKQIRGLGCAVTLVRND